MIDSFRSIMARAQLKVSRSFPQLMLCLPGSLLHAPKTEQSTEDVK